MATGESDRFIVLGERESRLQGEGADGYVEPAQDNMDQTRRAGISMQTSLRGIANKARLDKSHRFRNLFQLLNEEGLMSSWAAVNKSASSGVDRVSARSYAEDLHDNVTQLVERLERGSYRARLVRRRNIPKEGGKTRPLGIPVVEDKLLQTAVSRILGAIYEQDFQPTSYAYRPNRGAHEAVRDLTRELQFGCYGYVVEVDIKGFFDHINHDWLLRMLRERVDDRPFLRLIEKWLKAGVLEEDGQVIHPEAGSPQGGSISPILANIYLHYVLDLWFQYKVKPRCRARATMCRYADDVVFVFQHQQEARSFYREIGPRLARFGLQLAADKSRVVRFSRFHLGTKAKAFDFLGFEFRWIVDRSGTPRVTRRNSRKRFRNSLARVTEWCREHRTWPVDEIVAALNVKLRGYYNYYGVIGNYRSIQAFFCEARRLLFRWLNRRSHRRSYNWKGFNDLLRRLGLLQPRITELRLRQLNLAATC